MSDADPAHILGKLSSAKIDKSESIFKAFDQNNVEIQERVDFLEHQMEDNIMMGDFEKEQI